MEDKFLECLRKEPSYGKLYIAINDFNYGDDHFSFEPVWQKYDGSSGTSRILHDGTVIGILVEYMRNPFIPTLCYAYLYDKATSEQHFFFSLPKMLKYYLDHPGETTPYDPYDD